MLVIAARHFPWRPASGHRRWVRALLVTARLAISRAVCMAAMLSRPS
jgi:hypothetical protein